MSDDSPVRLLAAYLAGAALLSLLAVNGARAANPVADRDLVYANVGGVALKLDLYLPADSTKSAPLLVWIHGGSWQMGNRAFPVADFFTNAGFALASIDYRLTGRAPFPAQIYDCKAAIRWLRANASTYGVDPNRIVAMGHSAGGHLAALLGTTPDDPRLQPTPAYPLSTYDRPGTFFSAGGGLVSTAMDYLRFCQMLLDGGAVDGARVLQPQTVAQMFTRQTTPAQGLVFNYWPNGGRDRIIAGYAWGLSIGLRVDDAPHTVPGSAGDVAWAGLADTFFFIDPKKQLCAVAMSQYVGPDEEALGRALRHGVYGALR